MTNPVEVRVESTPNPNAVKLTLSLKIADKPTTYASAQAAEAHPAAKALFALPGVKSLFLLNDFITVTKEPAASWDAIVPEAQRILRDHFSR